MAAVVVAVVAALTVAVVVLRDDRPRLAAGEQLRSAAVPGEGRLPGWTVEVALPDGPVVVAVGEPVEELPSRGDDEPAVRPPDGGSFVGVEVVRDRTATPPALGLPVVEDGEVPVATYTLVVRDAGLSGDPRSYPLPGLREGVREGSWVAVDGVPDPEELEVEVSVGGVDQTVHPAAGTVDRGAASGLYGSDGGPVAGPARRSCGPATTAGGFRTVERARCSMETWTSGYLPGTGWADAGTGPGSGRWVVASYDTPRPANLRRLRGDHAYFSELFSAPAPRRSASLGGRRPDRVLTPAGFPYVVAWLVDDEGPLAGDRLELRVDVPVESLTDPDPVDEVGLRWGRDVPLPG